MFLVKGAKYPGQRLGWYLQSVNFYLHHLKTSGRSLDSPKHRRAQAAFAGDCAGWRESLDILDFDEGIMSEVHARDILCVLVDRLKPIDQIILGELAEGLRVCEIAENLKVSHVFVVQHRRRIARVAINLGISPVAASPIHRASSTKSKPAEEWRSLLVCWFERWLRLEGFLVTPRFAKRATKCFKVQRFFCLRIEREKRLQYMWTSRVRMLGGQKRKIH